MKLRLVCLLLGFLSLVLSLAAQTANSNSASAQVPPLIQFSNIATDEGGNTLNGVVSISFSLYTAQQGGEPLWTETQNNVQLDPTGHYSVQLGITQPNGVPTTLFTTGEAHWLGVQIAEQTPQPRVLLLSVPYALKAGDAATIGGLPPSAFVLAASPNGAAATYIADSTAGQSVSPGTATDVTTTGGTANFLPLFNGASTIIDSVVFQSATSPFKIGINTATPATTLDVKGAGTIRGILSLPANGTATATAGANSQPLNLVASAFNSGTSAAANQTFQWLAEPASNDSTTPSGTLNLLFGEGTTKPSETGLHIANNGLITFATGQTFPGTGTGDGTVTSVASGAGLTGGPITGSGTLSIATSGVTNAMLVNPSLTVAVGAGLTGGGSVALGASTTPISLATNTCASGSALTALPFTCSPFAALGTNRFTGNQTINASTGNALTATASSASALGLVGYNNATTGNGVGVQGQSYSPQNAAGVAGYSLSTTGTTYGVLGVSDSSAGLGVYGSGATGVEGLTGAATGSGVYGVNQSTSGNAYGVYGQSSSTAGTGVYGSGSGSGVTGFSSSTTGNGVVGINTNGGNAASFTGPVVVSGNQTVSGNVTATGTVTGATVTGTATVNGGIVNATTSYDLGGSLFASGSIGGGNAFLGFAGNITNFCDGNALYGCDNTGAGANALQQNTQGFENTAIGYYALQNNTTGAGNTASGVKALVSNCSASAACDISQGTGNTASGFEALQSNTTGSSNTALGIAADVGSGALTNATAIGANAEVTASNAMVLGGISGTNNGTSVSVGIGTTAPGSTLEVASTNNTGLGPTLTLTNGGVGSNVSSSLDFNTFPPTYGTGYNPTARILATDDGHYSSNLIFSSNTPGRRVTG